MCVKIWSELTDETEPVEGGTRSRTASAEEAVSLSPGESREILFQIHS